MRSGLLLLLCVSAFAAAPNANQIKVLQAAPIQFEQMPGSGIWTARGLGYAFRFENQGTAMRVGNRAMRVSFPGANAGAPFSGSDRTKPTNSFRGQTYNKIENFLRLRRTGIYPGIDIVYYGNGRELEYDFEVAPGADPSLIALQFDGTDAVRINEHGDLVIKLGSDEVTQRAPSIYQQRPSGEIASVEGSYRLEKNGTVRFALGAYDHSAPLTIDPSIFYSMFLAGSLTDFAVAVCHDAPGYIYVGGYTYSTDFPLGGYAYSTVAFGGRDIFVAKINPYAATADQTIAYSTYFGGGSDDTLTAMSVDANSLIYFTGYTTSGGYPLNNSYIGTISGNTHAVMTVLDSNQDSANSMVYSTYFGGTTGNEFGYGIYQSNYKVYITGSTTSTDYPVVGNAYQSVAGGSSDAFVAEFDVTQSGTNSLVYSSYLGDYGQDVGRAISVDNNGLIYVTGYTFSDTFPQTANEYQIYVGKGDAFFSVLDPNAGALVYSTFLGGSQGFEDTKSIWVDPAGQSVAITGYTMSSDFPVTQNAYQPVFPANGNIDPFSGYQVASNVFLTVFDMTKLGNGTGLSYSTYFGGFNGEVPYSLIRDTSGRYFFCGYTLSQNLPVTGNALNTSSANYGTDGFVAILDPSKLGSNQLVYSTYVTGPGMQTAYGVDIDNNGVLWVTGITTSNILAPGYAQYPAAPGTIHTFLVGLSLP